MRRRREGGREGRGENFEEEKMKENRRSESEGERQ